MTHAHRQPNLAHPIVFSDRSQAAHLLAQRLLPYRGEHPLILGIPRGAIPMARVIAEKLEADLDVVLVHKIGAPGNPEFAIGSVSEFGTLYRSSAVSRYEISSDYVRKSADSEIQKLKDKRRSLTPVRPPISPTNRIVIIVDDGIATGSTMVAAIRAVRSQNPKKVIVASPVASPSAVCLLEKEADELILLSIPENLFSISQFYENFPEVRDEQVLQSLDQPEQSSLKNSNIRNISHPKNPEIRPYVPHPEQSPPPSPEIHPRKHSPEIGPRQPEKEITPEPSPLITPEKTPPEFPEK